jgi:hypothetical protein
MKNKFIALLTIICSLIFVFGCTDPFELPNENNGHTDSVLVSIYIGKPGARTIQPGINDVAGYQLTFTGGTYEPVNITNGANRADVYLNNGTWTITAKAYKLDGTIGNADDEIASGSISVTISDGVVSGGAVKPIILEPITTGTGNGTLHYEITFESGVTGNLTLWQIDDDEKVDGFGTDGELSLSESAEDDFELLAGRYIAEAKLTATDGKIAFRREVVEIWQDTISAFIFAPTVYLDPDAILPNNVAVLSETDSKINGEAIGSGTGSGASEADPITYTFTLTTPANVVITLEADEDSLFSTISWATNKGALPNGVYSNGTLPTDLSTNTVLWVKIVSEDGGTATYYRFVNMVSVTYGNYFTVLTSNTSGISWSSSNLSITQSGIYHITGTGTETDNRIRVTGSNITADVTLKDVNINVSGTVSAVAFNPNANNGQGVTVNLTLEGGNTLRSGANVPGMNISTGTIMNITEASTGTLSVYGRVGNTGSTGNQYASTAQGGSGYSGWAGISIAGTMIVNGGTVTATGGIGGMGGTGWYSSSSRRGYPGGPGGSGGPGIDVSGIFTINNGTVTANGGNGGNGGNTPSASYKDSDYNFVANGGIGGTGIFAGSITINGGTVTAKGGNGGNGGNDSNLGYPADGGNGGTGISSFLTIDGNIIANGGSGGSRLGNSGTNGSVGSNIVYNTTLTADNWGDGDIPLGGEQWFKFTATASTQYIHVKFDTLNSMYVQVYELNRTEVGSRTYLYSTGTKYASRSLDVGQEYYIRVIPYYSYYINHHYSGTYQILFNTENISPGANENATELTAGIWGDGDIPLGGEQWFKFTATASTQYIHVSLGTLTDLYVQVYELNRTEVGSRTYLYSTGTKYASLSLNVGQEYYIRITPYNTYNSNGTYQITFNGSSTSPMTKPSNVTNITVVNVWNNGNITAGGEQWFKFTATASAQYIHVQFDRLTNLLVDVCDLNGTTVGGQGYLYGGGTAYGAWSLNVGQEYYIRVTPYFSSGSGTYMIAFNGSNVPPPITLPSNATTITVNNWTNGNITTADGEQWFKFTATASTQYIHVKIGTLISLYVKLCDSNGVAVGSPEIKESYNNSISRTLTVGQEYYIKVYPRINSGTYQIAFNASETAP